MALKLENPSKEHLAFRNELIEVVRKHGNALSAYEILAILSHLLGQVIALQDQRVMSPDRVMEMMQRNMELGNKEAVEKLMAPVGEA